MIKSLPYPVGCVMPARSRIFVIELYCSLSGCKHKVNKWKIRNKVESNESTIIFYLPQVQIGAMSWSYLIICSSPRPQRCSTKQILVKEVFSFGSSLAFCLFGSVALSDPSLLLNVAESDWHAPLPFQQSWSSGKSLRRRCGLIPPKPSSRY